MTWRTINGIRNEDIYHQLQLLSLHGQSKDALAKWELDHMNVAAGFTAEYSIQEVKLLRRI